MKFFRRSACMIATTLLAISLIPTAAAVAELNETDSVQLVSSVSADETVVALSATGASASQYKDVKIAVWSEDRWQDDIIWYSAATSPQGFSCNISIQDHRSAGLYFAHAYSFDDGEPRFLAESTFMIAPTEATAVFSQSDDQIKRGVFQISVTVNNCPSGIKLMQAPTWSDANWQDDLVWYEVSNPAYLKPASIEISDGSEPEFLKLAANVDETTPWTIEIPCASPIRDEGAYTTHIYIETNNGLYSGVTSTSGIAKLGPAQLEVSTQDDELNFTVKAYGGDFSRASSLMIPTWSTVNWQDDLIWYEAYKDGNEWIVEVPIINHRAAGEYICHAYATVGGQMNYVQDTGFFVSTPNAQAKISDSGNGFYEIQTFNIDSPSGIAMVHVPTWTNANWQDDLVWHASVNSGEDVWSCNIEAGQHNGEEGRYISHVYLTANNGIQVFIDDFETDVDCKDYIYVTGSEGTGRRSVWIKNPSRSGAVLMPTWSATDHQDDIVWYEANPAGDERYKCDVDCGRLKHFGEIITHVYIDSAYVGMTTFTITEADLAAYRGIATLSNIISASTSGFGPFGTDYNMSSPNGQWLQSAINGVVSGGRSLSMLMIDLKTGRGVGYNSNQSIYSASSIKGPYVAAINKFYPNSVNGYVAGTMHETITVSSNDGYSALRSQFGAGPMANLQDLVGAHGFPAGRNYVDINAKDLAKLWVGCYDYFYENMNGRSEWCRNLYTDPYLSFIHRALGARYTTHTKPGWIDYGGHYTARNDAGIVMAGDRPYILAIVSTAYGRDSALVNLVNAIDAVHTDMVH